MRRATIPVILLVLLTTALPHRAGAVTLAPKFTRIQLDDPVAHWYLDRSSGRIYASFARSREVREFDPGTGDEVRRFLLNGSPGGMLARGRHLVVALEVRGSPAVAIIDRERTNLDRNTVSDVLALSGDGPPVLFASPVPNSLVYALCSRNPTGREVFQLALDSGAVRRRVDAAAWFYPTGFPTQVAVSADGSRIVVDIRGPGRPGSVALLEVNEEGCRFRRILDPNASAGPVRAGPANRFWVVGNRLYDFDLTEVVREFRGSPLAIHPGRDLAISFVPRPRSRRGSPPGEYLELQSLTGGETVASVSLSGLFREPATSASSRQPSPATILRVDSPRDGIFLARGNDAALLDLKSLDVPLDPVPFVEMPASISVTAGGTMRLPLSVSEPARVERTHFEIENGPAGPGLEGRHFVWTPTPDDVGVHRVSVRATLGDRSDRATLKVRVERSSLPLDVAPGRLMVDRSGRRALLLEGSLQRGPGLGSRELVLVDLENLEVRARRRFADGIRAAHIDERGIYRAPAEGSVFFRLGDELETTARAFVEQPVIGFATLPPTGIAAIHGSISVHDSKSLKAIDNIPEGTLFAVPRHGAQPSVVTALSRDRYLLGHRVVDATGKLQAVVGEPALPAIVPIHRQFPLPHPALWNRWLNANALTYPAASPPGGDAIASWTAVRSILLRGHPAVASVRVERSPTRPTEETVILEIRDLLGAVRERVRVLEQYVDVTRSSSITLLEEAGDRLVLAQDRQLFVIPLPDTLEDLPRPLQFTHRRGLVETGVEDPVTVTFRATGGTGKLRYGLLHELEHVRLDPDTGELRADVPAIWKDYLEGVREGRSIPRTRTPRAGSADEWSQRYEQITGRRPPRGTIPVTIPLRVVVTDEGGQHDRVATPILVLAPQAELDAAVADLHAERARVGREGLLERPLSPGRGSPEARLRLLEEYVKALNERLEKIEKRLEEIEEGQRKK